ncbi:MAG: MFS transporter, partial [Betaproteobacteria bacterium]|nr:MFS transporter [Betaproteobacteria bacterium]
VATATFFIPLLGIILGGLPQQRVASAAGLSNFARITAGSFGASIYTTLWDHRSSLHHAQLAQNIYEGSPRSQGVLRMLEAGGLSHQQSLGVLNRLIDVQASTISVDEMFRLSAWLFVAMIVLVWLVRPSAPGAAGNEAAGAH